MGSSIKVFNEDDKTPRQIDKNVNTVPQFNQLKSNLCIVHWILITHGVTRLGDCWDVIVDDSLDKARFFYSFYRLGKREKTWRNIESGHLIFCSLRLWTDNIDKTVRYCLFMTSTIAGETDVWHQQISLCEINSAVYVSGVNASYYKTRGTVSTIINMYQQVCFLMRFIIRYFDKRSQTLF